MATASEACIVARTEPNASSCTISPFYGQLLKRARHPAGPYRLCLLAERRCSFGRCVLQMRNRERVYKGLRATRVSPERLLLSVMNVDSRLDGFVGNAGLGFDGSTELTSAI